MTQKMFYALVAKGKRARILGVFPTRKTAEMHTVTWMLEQIEAGIDLDQPRCRYLVLPRIEAGRRYTLCV